MSRARGSDRPKTARDVFAFLVLGIGLLFTLTLASGAFCWFGATHGQDAYELWVLLPSVGEVSEKISRFQVQEARVKAVEEDMRAGWYPDRSRVKEMITEELSRGGLRISDISVKEARFDAEGSGAGEVRTFGGSVVGTAEPKGPGPGALDVEVRGLLPTTDLYGFLAYLDGGGEASRTWTLRKLNMDQKTSAVDAAATIRNQGNRISPEEKNRMKTDLDFLQTEMTVRVVTQ